jgi:putative transposase
VAPSKSNITEQKDRRLTAQAIHELIASTLQTYFPIDTSDGQYECEDIWDVLIAASVERITVEMACEVLEDAPCGNTVRNAIQGILPEDEHIDPLEDQLNEVLVAHLPHKLLSRGLPCAVDFTELPYHGLHEEDDEYIRRGKAKSGTTPFHCYATLYTVKNNKRYTLAMVLVRQSEKAQAVLERLLKRAVDLGLRIKRLYLDRGFDNNGVIAWLKKQSFPSILPLIIRGKEGGSRALLMGRKSYTTTYTRNSSIYGSESFPVHVVCKYSKGRYDRHGLVRFAYVVVGELLLTPQQVYEEYRFRFGIEASYRLMNQVRARTTSRSPVFRLLLVGLAFLMLNLWSYVKWEYLSVSSSGPRQIFHHLLPLARWRLWLWEVVKQRLGFLMEIVVPEPT